MCIYNVLDNCKHYLFMNRVDLQDMCIYMYVHMHTFEIGNALRQTNSKIIYTCNMYLYR